MNLVCCCSNPACMVNGCMQAKKMVEEFSVGSKPSIEPYRPFPRVEGAKEAMPLTEEGVRRIVAEELRKAFEALK